MAAALTSGEYGKRPSSYPVRGWHHPGYHTGHSAYHYSLNANHPGFTGELFYGNTPIDSAQRHIELAGTLVHEYFHHKYPGETDTTGINSRVNSCVPGYIGT